MSVLLWSNTISRFRTSYNLLFSKGKCVFVFLVLLLARSRPLSLSFSERLCARHKQRDKEGSEGGREREKGLQSKKLPPPQSVRSCALYACGGERERGGVVVHCGLVSSAFCTRVPTPPGAVRLLLTWVAAGSTPIPGSSVPVLFPNHSLQLQVAAPVVAFYML